MKPFLEGVKKRLKYEGQVIFLPYIPDQDIASDFDYIKIKANWYKDFSQRSTRNF